MRAILELENEQYPIQLDESSEAVKDLIERTPLELKFQDYPPNEKIGNVNPALTLPGALEPARSRKGDICFSIPFENICLFMKDFTNHSKSLIHLGYFEQDIDVLRQYGKNFTAVLRTL